MSCVVLQVNTDCYPSQVFVHDWEADGTVGTLSIPVAAVFSEMVFSEVLEGCDTATGSTATTSNPGVCKLYLYLFKHMNVNKSELLTSIFSS